MEKETLVVLNRTIGTTFLSPFHYNTGRIDLNVIELALTLHNLCVGGHVLNGGRTGVSVINGRTQWGVGTFCRFD
jgi:hypothetical protein